MAEPLRLDQLEAQPALAQEFLRQLYAHDFHRFCRDVLGYTDMNREHQALCEFLQSHPAHTKLILMPRYTFKSSIATIGHTLWLLLNDPNQRLLLYADAVEKAEGNLLGIKNHLLGLSGTSKFRAICPDWEVDPKRGVWNQSAIVVSPRTQAHAEPSVDTAGLETSKVGKHYDRIKFDDLVTDKNITTKDLMDKVEQCYKKSLSLLKPSGHVELIGTRWHFGDLYGRLLVEYHGANDFAVFHRQATDGTRYFFADMGKESLTPEFLAQKKATQGTRLFSALYQNEPTSAEDQVFKAEQFRFYSPAKTEAFRRWASQLYITAVLDAIPPPTSDHGDDAAITVVGTDAEHTMYLLDAVASRMTPEQQTEELLSLHVVWKFRRVGIEGNAFQRMIKPYIERRLAELRLHPTWTPFSLVEFQGITQGNKEQRIQGLQPWHERGLIRLPGERVETLTGVWSQLAYQMLEFPHSQKDDLLDSLAYHLQLKQPGVRVANAPTIPYHSAAWAMQQDYHDDVVTMQRRPRWQRRPIQEPVLV